MSKDIRSFFTMGSKKPASHAPTQPAPKARKKAVIVSSDEDEPKDRKTAKQPTNSNNKRRIVYSDDEEDTNTPIRKKPNLSIKQAPTKDKPKLNVVKDVSDVFGDAPIKRIEKPTAKTNKTMTEEEMNSLFMDDLDIDAIPDIDLNMSDVKNGNKSTEVKAVTERMNDSVIEATPKQNRSKVKEVAIEPTNDSVIEDTPKQNRSKVQSAKKKSTPKIDLDSSSCTLTDEDRHERKRLSAMMYQQFKNRGGPAHPGTKEVPKGKPNCFNGLIFVLTGVYDSLERDEVGDIVKQYGGKVTTSLSKKTNFIVIGEEAGLAKIAKADDLGTKQLSEDEFLDLIRIKSGQPPKCTSHHVKGDIKPKVEDKESPRKMKDIKTPVKDIKRKIKVEESPKKIKDSKTPVKDIKPKIKMEESPKKMKDSKTPVKDIKPKIEMKESPRKTKDNKTPIKDKAISGTSTNVKNIKSENCQDIQVERTQTEHQKNIASVENQAWVEKYKPTTLKQVIGQQGAASNCVKLQNWLSKWYSNHDGKKKLQKPNPWAKSDDGGYYKAALLSGPPGVGKTTTATLVCAELGFDTVEFNASDTRSKRLLKEEVSELLSNKSLVGYFNGGKDAITKRHVLIMDEVDGMAGNEDRGGIQELISLIKDSSIPIICMCNDRNHQKMRSLVNYCYDLRFNRPRLEQIRSAMMSICFKEKIKLSSAAVDEIILATNNDIRQSINHLTLMSANNAIKISQPKADTAKKDMKIGPWEVVRKVFSIDEHKNMTIFDKSDLFFNDYSMGPLFVQQNYLSVAPNVSKEKILEHVALAADSLSRGDLVDNRIRSKNAWSMLPVQAMYSSVLPGEYMAGRFTGQINFPAWLGKYSKSNKRSRLAQEIHDHTRICTSGSRLSIRMDYAPYLIEKIIKPLRDRGMDGVEESLDVLKEYRLLREDIDSLVELTTWPGKKNPMDSVEGKVKASLTRAYNKGVTPYTYTATAAIKKNKSQKISDEFDGDGYGGEDEDVKMEASDDEEDDRVESDVLIKAKNKTATKKDSAVGSSSSSSSKKKATKATVKTRK